MYCRIILCLPLVALCACCHCKHLATTERQVSSDSTRIEYRERLIHVPDTVTVTIPAQTAERTTFDSLSHLENDYAESDARINADGSLFHSLNTKPRDMDVPTTKEVHQRDSIIYRDRWLQKTITKTVKVEKELSWWGRTQIYGFWLLLLVGTITHRKKLLNIIRTILRLA